MGLEPANKVSSSRDTVNELLISCDSELNFSGEITVRTYPLYRRE